MQALETLKRLEGVNGAVSMTLDKLPSIRGDLVRTDSEWEKWDFAKLVEALNQSRKKSDRETFCSRRGVYQETRKAVSCQSSEIKPTWVYLLR